MRLRYPPRRRQPLGLGTNKDLAGLGINWIRPALVVILLLSTFVVVMGTFPKSEDYAAKKAMIGKRTSHEKVVVNHGFLKIVVDLAEEIEEKRDFDDFTQDDFTNGVPVNDPIEEQQDNNEEDDEVMIVVENDEEEEEEDNQDDEKRLVNKEELVKNSTQEMMNTMMNNNTIANREEEEVQVEYRKKIHEELPDTNLIPIDVIMHKVMNEKNQSSLMSCQMSNEQLLKALEGAQLGWKSTGGIYLNYKLVMDTYDESKNDEFMKHLNKFPTNRESGQAWTTEHPGELGNVAKDLAKVLNVDQLTPWSRHNIIHAYCIGAFVGYNGLTWNSKIYIRSLKYHSGETELDPLTFERILAHEIGHCLNLRHPSPEFCGAPCIQHKTCNLMCQQRALPQGIDPRLARALSPTQRNKARSAAQLLDVEASEEQIMAGVKLNQMSNVKFSYSTPLVLFPIQVSGKVGAVQFLLSKMKSSASMAIVMGKRTITSSSSSLENGGASPYSLRVVATGSFQNKPVKAAPTEGISIIRFVNYQMDWWVNKRHLEAEIVPPLTVVEGEFIGVLFSSSSIGLQMIKGDAKELTIIQFNKSPPFSSGTLHAESIEVKGEKTTGFAPLMSFL